MSLNQSLDDRAGDRLVLILIGGGIVLTLLALIGAMTFGTLPDWAEGIFSAIAGGLIVKLADVLSALVALAGARQVGKLSDKIDDTQTGGEAK